ncbi:MAG: LysR family transcriptional regulator [Kofleriaceae bacterium]
MENRLALDPTLLVSFLAVHDAGRISAAAKRLHLSQPAVTAQIRRLEDALGVPLFTRSVRGVTPTDAGHRLVDHARAIQRLLADAVAQVSGAPALGGELGIGSSTTIAAHVLPPLLAEFRRAHAGVALRVQVGNTDDVLDSVRRGRVPLGLVEGHARAAGLRLEPFVDDEIVPIVGSGRAGEAFRPRDARDLRDLPILWREAGSGTRSVVERALARAGVRKRASHRDVELGSTEAIIAGAIAGLGIGFVSRWSIRAHVAAGLIHIPPGLDLVVRRTFRWAVPAGGLHGAAARFPAIAQRAPPSLA